MESSNQPAERGAVNYETRDVRFRLLSYFAAALVALLVLVAITTRALLATFASYYDYLPDDTIPQQTVRELNELQRREDELLGSYAWISRENGVVRIPIERAMQLVADEHEETNDGSR